MVVHWFKVDERFTNGSSPDFVLKESDAYRIEDIEQFKKDWIEELENCSRETYDYSEHYRGVTVTAVSPEEVPEALRLKALTNKVKYFQRISAELDNEKVIMEIFTKAMGL